VLVNEGENMTIRSMAVALFVAVGPCGPSVSADESTLCNAYITSLPYTITTQGHYCFNTNLSTAITTGAAITINVDHVVLDLNNFKLGGGAAGLGTLAKGIYANNRSNITIRNGNIRGFASGILIEGTNNTLSNNILIEDNVLADNTVAAIAFAARAVTVRNNVIYHTGGSTAQPHPLCEATWGITTYTCTVVAHSAVIVNNTIVGTFPPANGAFVFGVFGTTTSGALVANNRFIDTAGDGALVWGDGVVCRDNTSAKTTIPAGYVCTVFVGTNSSH
jgi:hypothetical protein